MEHSPDANILHSDLPNFEQIPLSVRMNVAIHSTVRYPPQLFVLTVPLARCAAPNAIKKRANSQALTREFGPFLIKHLPGAVFVTSTRGEAMCGTCPFHKGDCKRSWGVGKTASGKLDYEYMARR